MYLISGKRRLSAGDRIRREILPDRDQIHLLVRLRPIHEGRPLLQMDPGQPQMSHVKWAVSNETCYMRLGIRLRGTSA